MSFASITTPGVRGWDELSALRPLELSGISVLLADAVLACS